ncbi:DUF6286 domain-containing protein [Luedemannella helvata]|uniref:DUF6286 domain-containing protein n=1 Tax=Luedemannella helvata TaxID=349315 RepID=A0ABN2JXA1_9ACTN
MRTANRIGALLLGLVLFAGGLLVAVEAVSVAVRGEGWPLPLHGVFDTLTTTTAGDQSFLIVSIAVGVVGLIIFLSQVRPWAPNLVAVNAARSDGTWWMARRSVERRMASAANDVTGVQQARAHVRGGRRKWRVTIAGRGPADQRDAVTEAVQRELGRLDAPADTGLSVRLRPGRVA